MSGVIVLPRGCADDRHVCACGRLIEWERPKAVQFEVSSDDWLCVPCNDKEAKIEFQNAIIAALREQLRMAREPRG